jgi:hypothetical protein
MIVFTGFSTFFFIMLKNDLENFRGWSFLLTALVSLYYTFIRTYILIKKTDFVRSLENTVAMSIGKFNFGAIRSANEFAAWIFFMVK